MVLAMLLTEAAPQAAFALKATDTMSDWAQATDSQRPG